MEEDMVPQTNNKKTSPLTRFIWQSQMEEDMVPETNNDKKTSPLGSGASESTGTEWTDEKHSLYLKSMEASFVQQLYNSYETLGWRSQEDCSSGPKSSRQYRNSSSQFKVLRDGSWGTVNFRREESQLRKAEGTCGLSENPWIRHFRSGSNHQIVTSSVLEEKQSLAGTSRQLHPSLPHLLNQDSDDSDPELTGQNFDDEDDKSEKSSRISKRVKTSVVATTSNDQVVPLGVFSVTEDVPENCVSTKKVASL